MQTAGITLKELDVLLAQQLSLLQQELNFATAWVRLCDRMLTAHAKHVSPGLEPNKFVKRYLNKDSIKACEENVKELVKITQFLIEQALEKLIIAD